MATKRKSSQGVKRDVFVNRVRGRLTFGANSTTFVSDTIETGMNAGQASFKWVITHIMCQPAGVADAVDIGPVAVDTNLMFQLMYGTQAALLEPDDSKVICSKIIGIQETTGAGYDYRDWSDLSRWPLLAPTPVFAQTLTIGGNTGVDHAALQNDDWYYEIGYLQVPLAQNELTELLAARGEF